MGVIMHKNILYGGGSTIEPNPQESATEQLETLGIDGDVYEVTDADYRNTDHTFTMNTYSSYSHTFENTQISERMPVRNVFTAIQSVFNSVKTAINDHGSLFGDIATALTNKVSKDEATYKSLSYSSITHEIDDSEELTTQFDGAGEMGSVWFANMNLGIVTDAVNDHAEWIAKETAGSKNVTGNPLTITDAAGIKAEKIVIEFEPKQAGSGTPSPSNIRPITGYTSLSANRCGKNECKIVDGTSNGFVNGVRVSGGVTYTNNNGVITISGTRNANSFVTIYNSDESNDIHFVKNTSYIISNENSYATTNVYLYNGDTRIAQYVAQGSNETTFTFPDNCTMFFIQIRCENNGAVSGTVKPMIRKSTVSDATFEPFKGDNVTIQLGQTLYGGKLTILQDGSADIDVTNGCIDMGSVSWTYESSVPRFKSATISDMANKIMSTTNRIRSSCFEPSLSPIQGTGIDGTIGTYTGKNAYVIWKQYTDATQFKTAVTGQQFWYELETPFTLHLSPVETLTLLQGINNVWTDGTTLSLTYQPDNAIGEAKGTAQDAMAIANGLKPLYSTGSVGSGKTGSQIIAEITLPEAGIYYITGWARFTGNGKKAVWLWCEGSLSESWEDSNISTAEPKTFSTFAIYTASAAGKVVQVDSYTVSASNAVTGGLVAFKIA